MRLKCCLLLATATHAFLARRLGLLRRRTARSAVATCEEANATLLACAQAPDLFYLGDNETLYLRYLNSTRQLQNAKVEPKTIKADNKELITQLWRDRRMIVHDKAAYRKLVDGGDTATTQLSGGCRRAAAIWDDNRGAPRNEFQVEVRGIRVRRELVTQVAAEVRLGGLGPAVVDHPAADAQQ